MKSYSSHLTHKCDICGFETHNEKEIITHVAAHLGLSYEEYREYNRLLASERAAGTACSITKNKHTEEKFDAAIAAVLSFEKEHGLTRDIIERGYLNEEDYSEKMGNA